MADPRQKDCVLIFDEVYLKTTLQYHGGSIYGEAAIRPGLLANTMLCCFIVVCMFGGPKFIVKMFPVLKLDTTFLIEQTKLILEMLKKSSANPTEVVCDGNRVNQSLFKQFETIKPWRTCEDLFLLFDYVTS